MNKLINHPDHMVKEMLNGYLGFYKELFHKVPDTDGLVWRESLTRKKVSVVVAGGAGNEPWVMGFVGRGLADGAALGQVYTAPPARHVLKVTKAVPNEMGVLYIAGNHTGDVLNFELVRELAEMEGIQTHCIYVSDDITSAPKEMKEERRGSAGIALVVKIAGAACDEGLSLLEAARITKLAKENTYTFGVTTSTGYMPGTGDAMCELPDGMMEFGMGFNGETGISRQELKSANETADIIVERLIQDMELTKGNEIALMLNGYGFTSILELCIVGRRVKEIIESRGIRIHNAFIDTLFAPQGTGGFSVTILRLDEDLKQYYDKAFYSPLLHWKGGI